MVDDYSGPSRPLIARKNWTLEAAAQRQNATKKTGRNGFERQLPAGATSTIALCNPTHCFTPVNKNAYNHIKYSNGQIVQNKKSSVELASSDEGPFVFGLHSPNQFQIRSRVDSDYEVDEKSVINNVNSKKVHCDNRAKSEKCKNKKKKKKKVINKEPPERKINCLLLGDGAVGKTSMITSYAKNTFQSDYNPTGIDNYKASVYVDQQPYKLEFWDTTGRDNLEGLRKRVCYPEADVVLLCFSTVIPESFLSIEDLWIPRASVIKAPLILVGTQCDLRDNPQVIHNLRMRGDEPIYTYDGRNLATKLNAAYYETSSKTGVGLKDTFDAAILAALPKFEKKSFWKRLCCLS